MGKSVMYHLKFELHGLPKTPNGAHGHWAYAAAERKKWRYAACQACLGKRPRKPLEAVKIILTRFSSMQPDHDNLVASFKPVIDGLKDAGVIVDDKDAVVRQREVKWQKVPAKEGKISVEVIEL